MAVGIWKSQIHTFSTSHITTERGAWIWKLASKLNFLSVFVYYCTKVCRSDWKTLNLSLSNANGHITLNTPVLVRSLKLSNVESSQYLDGWPPGNTGCCWLLTFYSFLANFSVKESLSKFLEPLVILLVSCNLLPKRILKTKKIGFPDHFENSWKFLWGEKSRFLSQFFCAQKTWFFAS